jgi:hypothetical protein
VSLIPTEMVTGYLAAVAAVVATTSDQNSKLGLRWLLLVGFSVLTPIAVWSLWNAKLRPDDPVRNRRAPFLEMATATLAFLVWRSRCRTPRSPSGAPTTPASCRSSLSSGASCSP